MSAIAGIIDRTGSAVSLEAMETMAKPIRGYKVDQVDIKRNEGCGMICGHQWITVESRQEILPFFDEAAEMMMTADLILDNREALGRKLGLDAEALSRMADGALLFQAYRRWGIRCLDHLVGDFAFVIYDVKADLIFAAIDQVGKRILNYQYEEGAAFIFSTTFEPLLALRDGSSDLNEAWIAEFLALRLNFNVATIEETVHAGIYQLAPGEMLTIEKGALRKEIFWSVERLKPIKLDSDEAYLEEFRRCMSEAVKCRIRTAASVGLMLSGGLDSSTVAAFAAPMLKKQGKKLYAYTSVPMKDAQLNLKASQVADESSYIQELIDMYDNIEWTPTDSAGYDSYNQIDETLRMLEMPYKMVVNMHWTNHLTQLAAEQGCKVLLDGQFGNFTISQGEVMPYLGELLKRGNWSRFLRELKAFGKVYGVGRKRILRAVVRNGLLKGQVAYEDIRSELINEDFEKMHRVKRKFARAGMIGRVKSATFNRVMLSHIGNVETRIGLQYGLIQRDPTRDMRVMAYCHNIPSRMFVKAGYDRALVRLGMEGLIPERILRNMKFMGIQGADWGKRLQIDSKRLQAELFSDKAEKSSSINPERLNQIGQVLEQTADIAAHEKNDLKDLLIALTIMRYRRNYEAKRR